MKRGDLILVLFVSCQPTFQDGKTLCSDKLECPSGFVCGNNGTNYVCFDNKIAGCPSGYFYCADSGTCTTSLATCSTTSTGGSSGSTSTCSASQLPQAGGTCNVLPACGCPAGKVCYPDTQSTGLKCFTSGSLGEGADCTNGTCASGLGCFGDVCKKYCQSDSDCTAVDSAQSCDSTYWGDANNDTIDGVSVCSRVCDPVKPQSPRSPLLACPVGFGCFSMDSYPGASDCESQSGSGVSGSTCVTDNDCKPGFYCGTGSTGDTCFKYCYTAADCPTGMTCVSFSTPNYAGTTQVNHCQ